MLDKHCIPDQHNGVLFLNDSVTGPTRREACRSICKLLLIEMVKNTGRVEQMANRYIEGKTDEYSSKRAWSTIANNIQRARQRDNSGNKQKARNQTTRPHGETRLKLK